MHTRDDSIHIQGDLAACVILIIIILSAADAVRLFGYRLKLSGIAAVPQDHRRLCLISNL